MANGLQDGMYMKIIVVGFCLCSYPRESNLQRTSVDYYTSQHGLRKLATVEEEVAKAIAKYVGVLEKRLEKAKRFLSDYETSGISFNSSSDIESASNKNDVANNYPNTDLAYPVSAHPLRAYRLLRRYVQDLPTLEKDLRSDEERKFLKLTEKVKTKIPFPTQLDMQGATEGILRVHDTYNMNIDDFTSGNFYGLLTNTSVNAADCFYIGIYALKSTILTRAIQWLERAHLLVTQHGDKSISKKEIKGKLKEAISQIGEGELGLSKFELVPGIKPEIQKHNEALQKRSQNPYLFTKPVTLEDALREESKMARRRVLDNNNYLLHNKQSSFDDLTNFAALCSGKELRNQLDVSKLKCWYESRQPVNTLQPLKIESHSVKPMVLQIHDLITDVMIEKILKTATDTMSRSQVFSKTRSINKMISSARTSTTTWLDDDRRSPLKGMRRVYRRIEGFTGLNILAKGTAELLQVSCYGIAGHFNPHLDTIFNSVESNSLSKDERERGDRLATIMLYLSDVVRGGATAFPRLGVTVQPVKGSAIFWYNMNKEGEPDELSLHGGCPILYGNKCVSNKWIRFNSQSLHCSRES